MANDTPGKSALALWRDILLIATLIISGLYAGAGFLIPLTLAALIFVLITALSDKIARSQVGGWHPPQWLSYLLGTAAAFVGLFAVTYILANQASQFARALPYYESQVDTALTRIAALLGEDVVAFIRTNIIQIDMSRIAVSALGSAGTFLSTFFLICLYVVFMIGERAVLGTKFELAARDQKLRNEIRSISDAISRSLQRYVSVKSFVSALTALFSYAVFRLLGLEFAETWAVLTFALNFIPSIGSVLAVILPALVALIQFETISPFLLITLGCGSVQFLVGNILDPALTGRSLNLSTFMVILALTFWSAIWGLLGAFMSVPLTVCILIVFAQIPAMRPLAILMSKDGHLATAATAPETGTGRHDPG
ncbi:AI-2E family transporter [Sedimentitalea todarodis]|uniref:AI-2E family transporter n=1 Tax=Sedimentitalea todarodis TaxID=1631240 RepID=A0ABU3VAV6_9RHOB|nr:AI-2E family transporter [Sedimentitalea todarodis]MDU9003307.1 AI-2E family transporter [Sedimentitalea todarodis]